MTTNVSSMAYDDAAGITTAVTAATPLPVTASGSGATAQQVQGNVASGVADAGNPVKIGAVYKSSLPSYSVNNARYDLVVGATGGLLAQLIDFNGNFGTFTALADGAANTTGLNTFSRNAVWNGTTWDRLTKATAASRIPSSANSTNATVAKGSAGTLHAISGYNSNAAVRYLKVYNKATAPTVGTDTPILTIPLPPTSPIPPTLLPMGLYFSAGISYALTTGAADADTGAVGAGDILGLNLAYS